MTDYIARRLMGMALNLVLVSIFVFAVLRIMPGDIAISVLGQEATTDQLEKFRQENGLYGSLWTQFTDWSLGVLTGDFGKSLLSRNNVTEEFFRRLPITLEVVLISFVLTTMMGIAFGTLSAVRHNSILDVSLRMLATLALAVPNFLLLTLLLIVPARMFSYAPPFGATDIFSDPLENLRLILPPALILSLSSSAVLMRFTRSGFLEVMRQDYIRTARSKGLNERSVYFRHAFRNALPPILTLAGLQLGGLLGGSIILERVMGLPGLGSWILQAIQFKDYPVVMIVALYNAVVLMTINLVIDICYGLFDPRIRYS